MRLCFRRLLAGLLAAQATLIVYIVVQDMEPLATEEETQVVLDDDTAVENPAQVQAAVSPDVTKVIIVSYMRGGSTALGEIFNQNPEVAYWFEPADGAYSALYGLAYGTRTHEITHFLNRTYRYPKVHERDYIIQAMLDIFYCQLDDLPLEVVEHPFVVRLRETAFTAYGTCVKNFIGQRKPLMCRRIKPLCLRKPRVFDIERCIEATAYMYGEIEKKYKDLSPLLKARKLEKWVAEGFAVYKCYKAMREARNRCKNLMQNACDRSQIRVIKSVRLTMDYVKILLREDPNMKVIYLLRDPRGIVASRGKTGLLSENAFRNKGMEAKMLCDLMRRDISVVKFLSVSQNRRILSLTYEAFATAPIQVSKSLYDFIGHSMPPEVGRWLHNSTHAQDDDGVYKASRMNATATAYFWRTSLSRRELSDIDLFCRDIYGLVEEIHKESLRKITRP